MRAAMHLIRRLRGRYTANSARALFLRCQATFLMLMTLSFRPGMGAVI